MRQLRHFIIISFAFVLVSISIGCAHQESVVSFEPVTSLATEESSFVTIDDITIHWESAGEDLSTTPLVLLHGFGANTGSWMYLMPPLSESYPVYAYDRIPFGLSERYISESFDRERSPYRSEAIIERAFSLLDEWGIDEAVLVGSSAGGTVALQMALADPERIKALILIDPAVYSGGGPGFVRFLLRFRLFQGIALNSIRGLREEPEKLLEDSWYDPSRYPEELKEAYIRATRVENWDRALLEFTRASAALDLKDRLEDIGQKVLLIHGRQDSIIDVKESIRLAEELPFVEFHIIEESGHLPHEENTEEVLRLILDFLKRIENGQ
ncbi:MAG: alpha/beta hydrolase [Sphaerochaetaceae bacterium]|nr:alpha/beta hydrolase [Sphaerochaetaceae bacterium]